MLVLREVSVPGRDRPRLRNVSLSLAPGERVALLGASGAGKSTLLGVANGLIPPAAGSVSWFGEPAARSPGRRRRQLARIGTLWQDLRLVEELTVQQNLNSGRLASWSWPQVLLNLFLPVETSACAAALAQVELDGGLLNQSLSALSGGQRQRVAIARVLRQNAQLLLADEPLAQLDPPLARRLLQLLLQLGGAPRGLLLSLHRPDWLAGFDRVVGLRQGEVLFDLPLQQLGSAQLDQLYASPCAV
ncbi:MAG: ATP-binding cassette domain-containing protein [Synechococcus sp.]|nr:ATP-binding cassette domain-containing protein [Synechococcus sp.]